MEELTVRQAVVLKAIKKFIEKHGVPPTYSEVGAATNMSANGAYEHIQAIAKKGYIEFSELPSRNIKVIE